MVGGYRGEIIEMVKAKFGYVLQVVMRTNQGSQGFKPDNKRWIVKRTFA